MNTRLPLAVFCFALSLSAQFTPPSGGGGSSASPQHYTFKVACQGGNAAAGASWPSSNGLGYVPVCDSAGGSVDGYMPFTTPGTTVLQFGPIYLDSSFVDGVPVVIQWMTANTSGTLIAVIYSQCVSSGGIVSSSGWGNPTSFASSTANSTPSHVTFVTLASLTTSCNAGQNLYLQVTQPASPGGGTATGVNLKVLDVQVK